MKKKIISLFLILFLIEIVLFVVSCVPMEILNAWNALDVSDTTDHQDVLGNSEHGITKTNTSVVVQIVIEDNLFSSSGNV